MDVSETRLRVVLGGDQRYRVPLFQRPYSWSERQLARLWADLLDLTREIQRNEKTTHFTGSLVLDLGRAGPGVNEYLIVDGQQRLTSLSILLCAIRDHFAENTPDQPQKRELIHERYLIDKYKSGDDRLKLLPTQADRDSYREVVDGSHTGSTPSKIANAYRFFRLQLQLLEEPEEELDVDQILEAALGGLAFVSITARGDDNVYRIFESLNNTGMKLTQGDLLRNYIFMRLGARGEEAYSTWWLPMQDRLSPSDLEALFWMDLVSSDSEVKQGDIYSAQHDRLDSFSTAQVFEEVKRYAGLARLLEVMRRPGIDGRFGAKVESRLARLLAWGATAADPLVLHMLSRFNANTISSDELELCLATIESFLVRRLVVGAPPNALSRILLRAPSDMRSDVPIPEALLLYLSSGRKFFASDDQVRDAAKTKPLYYMGRPNQKKLLLQWLEDTYESKEPIDLDQATIEHILPQTLTPYWRDVLAIDANEDESAESIHEAIEHTLGNLTLSGYNSELSNHDFPEKRALFAKSRIRMNAEVAKRETWGRPEILERSADLANRIISTWLAPVFVSDIADTGATWTLVRDSVESIAAGSWTTYGELAALAGTYPQPVAAFVTRNSISGAWRVLQAAGTISPGFRWGPRIEFANRTPMEVLEVEGVRFDADGRADPKQRLSSGQLAELLGLTFDQNNDGETGVAQDDDPRFVRFTDQLGESRSASALHGALELIDAWRALGGFLDFGSHDETSCFLMARRGQRQLGSKGIWPLVMYPKAGTVEVVFQYLKDRPPFDRLDLRQQLRSRLNRVEGIDISEDRIHLRPSFPISVLETESNRAEVEDVLRFFMSEVEAAG